MYFYKGFNENVCTFKASGNIAAGQPVTLCDNCTVLASLENTEFHGVAVSYRNGAAAVQLTGYVELPYSGTAPGIGTTALVADGNGGVMMGEAGKKVLVISVDTVSETVGIIL